MPFNCFRFSKYSLNPSAKVYSYGNESMYIEKSTLTNTCIVDGVTYTGGWIDYTPSTAIKLQYYSFIQTVECPTSWIVAASNDSGATWTLIDSVTDHTVVSGVVFSKQINSTTAYSLWRIIILSTTSTNLIQNPKFDDKLVTSYGGYSNNTILYTLMTQAEKDETKWYADFLYRIGNLDTNYTITEAYPSSPQVLILQYNSDAYQYVYLYTGFTYKLSMYISKRPGYTTNPISIYLDSTLITTFTPPIDNSWQYVSVSFTVTTTGNKKLKLSGVITGDTTAVDNIILIQSHLNISNLSFYSKTVPP